MALIKGGTPAWLVLANGQVFEGRSFGASGTAIGEVVFTTGMTGYQETLTDPSNYGQIVTQTFPLIGNYGVNSGDYESPKSHVSGYIVREWCNAPSNFRMEDNLESFMKQHNIIGLYNIDTRSLTRMLRDQGVMNGAITTEDPSECKEELLCRIQAYEITKSVENVTCKQMQTCSESETKFRVVLYDFGCRKYICEHLTKRGCEVTIVPASTGADEVLALRPDGVVLSNGPGNPAENTEIIANIRKLAEHNIPMFGISLGHQLLALAMGAKTEKLKYGHRGVNQPVIDLASGRTYVTEQNHGYAVLTDSITAQVGEISHVNANDKTCEGVRYTNANAFGVQFHPRANGNPMDTDYLFDEFVERMQKEAE